MINQLPRQQISHTPNTGMNHSSPSPPKSAFRSHQSCNPTARRLARRACLVSPGTAPDRQVVDQAVGSLSAGRLGCTAHTPPAWRRRRNAKGLGSTKNRTTFPSFFHNLYIIFTTYPLLLSNHPFIFVSWIITWGGCIFTWTDGEFGLFWPWCEVCRRRTFAEAEADDVAHGEDNLSYICRRTRK